MALYAERQLERGERLSGITRHMLGLLAGEPGAREYRRLLSEGARQPGADADLLRSAALRAAAQARQEAGPAALTLAARGSRV
jgi:tRNA-dihydrouridine synthase A